MQRVKTQGVTGNAHAGEAVQDDFLFVSDISAALPPAAAVLIVRVCSVAKRAR